MPEKFKNIGGHWANYNLSISSCDKLVNNKDIMLEFEKVLAYKYLDIRKRDKAFVVELKKDEKVEFLLLMFYLIIIRIYIISK